MTRIDFYLLGETGSNARPMLACKLAEKAFRQGHQVYVNTASTQELRQLDDLLWTFRPGSFLPHAICQGPQAVTEPILIGYETEPQDCNDVLVNLSHDVPPYFSRFSRVAEIVDGDDARRTAARQRFRFYKDRGYSLTTHEIELD